MALPKEDKIPVVDLENLYEIIIEKEDAQMQKIAKEFGNALHEYGFVYVVNHGIPQKIIDEAFAESLNFFNLPPPIKEQYVKKDAMQNFHGYARPGMEFLNADSTLELRETYDIFQLERYYPKEAPKFKENLEVLEDSCKFFYLKLLKLLALALDLEDINFFVDRAQNLVDRQIPSMTNFRTLYYPPIPPEIPITPGTLRCAAHSDWGILTLLFQDAIGGLDVKRADDKWVQAEPIPGSIVVNTGDLLEAWTGEYFPATTHRVLVPESEIKKRTHRQSIALFVQPDDDIMVTPLRGGILKDTTFDFEPIRSKDHFVNQAAKAYGKY